MSLRVKIIGSSGFTPWKSRLVSRFTSARFFWKNKSLQIDIGNKYEGQPVDWLLITHTHYDHIQEIASAPLGTKVLVPSATFIDKLWEKNPNLFFQTFKTEFDLDGLKVKPFVVLHSKTTLTYGFTFKYQDKKIVWLSDYFIIPLMSSLFSNVDVLFLGASALKQRIRHKDWGTGQAAIYPTLKKIQALKNPPKKIYLIHFGMGMRPLKKKVSYLQKEFPKLHIEMAVDGQEILIP